MLRDNIRLLGELLGQTIAHHRGPDMLARIEHLRTLAKSGRQGDQAAKSQLLDLLKNLPEAELVPVARAFNQFLNLANIAEQYHRVRRHRPEGEPQPSLHQLLGDMVNRGVEPAALHRAASQLKVDLVLTAHPTEIARRTLIQKYDYVAEWLEHRDHADLDASELAHIRDRLQRLVSEIWHTDEIRQQRPTPIDEAKWGFAVIENSLWEAVPNAYRALDRVLRDLSGEPLPLDVAPLVFSSWMGGDRDGNPNVTAETTREVLLLGRWMAADLYWRDLDDLVARLSMHQASAELRALAGDDPEPYRAVLKRLRERVRLTRDWLEERLAGPQSWHDELIWHADELVAPLRVCYQSLCACGMDDIANGDLLDTLRRLTTFGINLVRLDIRQESTRHTEALSALTEHLGLGRYGDWDEAERLRFLETELRGRRPLMPPTWEPAPEVAEVFATCRVIAEESAATLGAYVISMATEPSDVLAVKLLLREAGVTFPMRIVPLFETLDDLRHAPQCLDRLYRCQLYRDSIGDYQEVMIGYSDSAKDAGAMGAAWAQYQAQEQLVAVSREHGVKLTLFHGRGGSVGRGGAPSHQAILSQPPGSVDGSLRVTEQGEMIRFKFGLPAIAEQSLALYLSATLEATLLPPPAPEPGWRALMDRLSATAVASYRQVVQEDPDFVPYFRAVTPEQELSTLALGSRPAKRRPSGGVESLRAIPWIFAWTQMRLLLPAWLGSDEALSQAMAEGERAQLQAMIAQWPFFQTHVAMLEMVLAKADADIAAYYEQVLAPPAMHSIGEQLRARLQRLVTQVKTLKDSDELLADNRLSRESIQLRNPYIDPLHYLQAELLSRARAQGEHLAADVDQALKVTMAGIAAGMRNTG